METEQSAASSAPQTLNPQQLDIALGRLRTHQNLVGGAVAGLVAAAVGAAVWAGVTIGTGYQIGWMAVGIGFLVGLAVRTVGKGLDPAFGIVGAVLALLGCGAGNLLAVVGMVAQAQSIAYMDVLSRLDVSVAERLMVATFSPMDLLFYGIAVYEGYKLSFRQLTHEQLQQALAGP